MKLNLITVLIFLLSLSSFSNKNKKESSPNFIIILVDDQGWNGTSVQMMDNEINSKSDFYQTPNIEKLAKKGIRFSSAYASAPVCAPSRYSIQFGQTPARLKMIRVGMNTSHINHSTDFTIPKQLKSINPDYVTAHFGKWGMGSSPSVLGYDESDGATGNKDGVFTQKPQGVQWENTINEDPKKMFSITKNAIEFIDRQTKSNNPFFLQLSHYAVHSNVLMREKTLKKYKNTPKGKYQKHTGFAAMTEDLDDSLGLLFDKIEELGIEENTYIIYTSDNGSVPVMPPKRFYKESFNYPLSRGKWDATEGGIRVPFIVTGPGIEKNVESKSVISFSDILPTIIDLAGKKIKNDKFLDGGSLKNVLKNHKKTKVNRNTDGLFFHVPYENGIALKRAHSAVILENFKLMKFYDNGQLMLFDLDKDLSEKNDLSSFDINKALELELLLDNYLKQVGAPKWKPGIHWRNKPIKLINSFH
ncbi:MAG: sulfatase [Flavobacteriaceae bacterium]|mgnify:FL=1|nr:sulfatase [Flavobacteriaceae bacterium]